MKNFLVISLERNRSIRHRKKRKENIPTRVVGMKKCKGPSLILRESLRKNGPVQFLTAAVTKMLVLPFHGDAAPRADRVNCSPSLLREAANLQNLPHSAEGKLMKSLSRQQNYTSQITEKHLNPILSVRSHYVPDQSQEFSTEARNIPTQGWMTFAMSSSGI